MILIAHYFNSSKLARIEAKQLKLDLNKKLFIFHYSGETIAIHNDK